MNRESGQKTPLKLPPLALARAMDKPYKPGQRLRQVLIGIGVVAALLALFLTSMPPPQEPTTRAAAPDATAAPEVVYQNLRTPVAPLPARSDQPADPAAAAAPP